MFMFCLYKMLGKFLDLELGTNLEVTPRKPPVSWFLHLRPPLWSNNFTLNPLLQWFFSRKSSRMFWTFGLVACFRDGPCLQRWGVEISRLSWSMDPWILQLTRQARVLSIVKGKDWGSFYLETTSPRYQWFTKKCLEVLFWSWVLFGEWRVFNQLWHAEFSAWRSFPLMSESHCNCFDRAFQCKEVTTQCALAAKSSYPLVDFSHKPTSKWRCSNRCCFVFSWKKWRKFKSEFRDFSRLGLWSCRRRQCWEIWDERMGDISDIWHVWHMTLWIVGQMWLDLTLQMFVHLPKILTACQGISTCRACFSNAQGHRNMGIMNCSVECFVTHPAGNDHILSPFKGTVLKKMFFLFPQVGYVDMLRFVEAFFGFKENTRTTL